MFYTTGGTDYDGNPRTVNIPSGVTMQQFGIDITNDNIVECIERFNVRITSVTTCRVTIGDNNMSEVRITDDDSKSIKLDIFLIILKSFIYI